MNEFCKALVSNHKNPMIPDECDYFSNFIGEWDMKWTESIGTPQERTLDGEWIFSRVLNGTGIMDLFIVPSRKCRKTPEEKNAEYGTTIRVFNPGTKNWEVYYTCINEYTRLESQKINDKIVVTEKTEGKMKWVFSDIKKDSFRWQNLVLNENNEWKPFCDCFATRRK